MPYSRRVILHAPAWDAPALENFVKDCIRDGVFLVCVMGEDCARVEDVVDELVVGDASDDSRFLQTTSHPDATIDEVRDFATAWTLHCDPDEPVQEVRLFKR